MVDLGRADIFHWINGHNDLWYASFVSYSQVAKILKSTNSVYSARLSVFEISGNLVFNQVLRHERLHTQLS
jgi:hypothetical protein